MAIGPVLKEKIIFCVELMDESQYLCSLLTKTSSCSMRLMWYFQMGHFAQHPSFFVNYNAEAQGRTFLLVYFLLPNQTEDTSVRTFQYLPWPSFSYRSKDLSDGL